VGDGFVATCGRLVVAVSALLVAGGTVVGAASAGSHYVAGPYDREWLRQLTPTGRPALARGSAAERYRARIVSSVERSGASLVAVRIYAVGSALVADIDVRTTDAATYLRHRFQVTLQTLRTQPRTGGLLHLRISDPKSIVLDWYLGPETGSMWLRPDVAPCSPVQPVGQPVLAEDGLEVPDLVSAYGLFPQRIRMLPPPRCSVR
jgi:hypothetical protein